MSKINRQIALNWWNSLDSNEQLLKIVDWLESNNRDTNKRRPSSLTGREIEEIMEKEIQDEKQSILNMDTEINYDRVNDRPL